MPARSIRALYTRQHGVLNAGRAGRHQSAVRRYFLFMRDDRVDFAGLDAVERTALVQRFTEWTEALREAGRLRGVARLEPGARVVGGEAAASDPGWSLVRASAQQVQTSDPLAVGLHVIDACDDEEAVALAQACPILALGGSVEVREVRGALR